MKTGLFEAHSSVARWRATEKALLHGSPKQKRAERPGYPYVRASGPACRTAADCCYGERIVPCFVLDAAVIRADADLIEH